MVNLASPVDASVLGNIRSYSDYARAQDEFNLKKQLAAAEIAKAQSDIVKNQYPDIDKLGEVAIYKAAQGIPLSLAEQSAARFVNAKSGGVQYDPVSGGMVQKPNIASSMGLNLGNGAINSSAPNLPNTAPAGNFNIPSGSGYTPPQQGLPMPSLDLSNPYDQEFKTQFESQAANPRAQQSLLEKFAAAKFTMNDEQTKAAGFADRMAMVEPVLSDPKKMGAMQNFWDKQLDIPMVGNYLTSKEYQSAKQAQSNFINALYRRESGMAISPVEFRTGREQYFPQPGEDKTLLEQKEANRAATLKGVQRSAGPAYKLPTVQNTQSAKPQITKEDAIAELRRRGKIK